MLPLNLYARVRFLFVHFARETAGAARTRSSLRPLLQRVEIEAKLGRIAPRDREAVFVDTRCLKIESANIAYACAASPRGHRPA
jgi:hypothetical protein